MSPERWQEAKRLFDEALERSPESRTQFLHEACAGDRELLGEVTATVEPLAARNGNRLAIETGAAVRPTASVAETPKRALRPTPCRRRCRW